MGKPKFSEEKILSVSKTTHAAALDNLTALSFFGVTETKLSQFNTDIQTAEALPGETQNKIEIKGFTKDKDETLDSCYQWGRQLRIRLELAFGKTSFQAKSFPSKEFKIASKSENKMMTVMEALISIADKYKAELSDVGQTPEMLTQGSDFLSDLRESDSVQEVGKDKKLQATQDRHQQFKNLYDTVNKINRVGRVVFAYDPIRLALFLSKW